MIAELAGLLLETTLATSLAAALVLVLRRPLRRVVGARGAYALWLLLPIAGLAVLIPARTVMLAAPPVASVSLAPLHAVGAADVDLPFDAQPLLIALWSAGAIGLGLVLGWQQRRFRRALGRLRTRADGSWQADNVDAGPAVIGLLRGRIVLPADFDSRYTDLERDLVLRHERVHLARRDPLANLTAAVLRCLYWFNPLLHYAVGRFRFDQELAVDAAVLAQRPEARRSYADAMLKTQLMLDPPPLGCHWQSAHPLKERIAMLKHPLPGAVRIAAGFAFAVLLSAGTGYAAWANQPEQTRLENVPDDEAAMPLPTYRSITPPKYPKAAVEEKRHGKVMLHVLVGADGSAQQIELGASSGSTDLDEAALAAVRKWKFNAANEGAQAAPVWVGIPIDFSLNESAHSPAPASSRALEEIYVRPKPGTSDQTSQVNDSEGTRGWTSPPIDRWLQRLSSPTDANVALTLAEAADEPEEC